MNYSICSEIKLKCRVCGQQYDLLVKDKTQVNDFKVRCSCHTNITNEDEVNEYGNYKKG